MRLWLVVLCIMPVEAALAAGGAHVVDDAEVETPGVCHFENWYTHHGAGRGLANSDVGCTLKAHPHVELNGAVQHVWDRAGATTYASPSIKMALRPVAEGLGVAASGTATFDLDRGRLDSFAVTAPLTVALSPKVRAHANFGYQWARTGDRNALFWGAQLDVQASDTLALMGEVFGLDRGPAGVQAGLRWTPKHWIDVDLLGGRYVDGASPRALTLGITIRR